jgi:clan AA aspartic protease
LGILCQEIEIGDPTGTRFQALEAMVDTGASYTVVPSSVLEDLGICPHRRMGFRLADGTRIEKDVGAAMVRVMGQQETSMVVSGPDDGPVLLGAVALETFALAVDPLGQRLISVDGLLLDFSLLS